MKLEIYKCDHCKKVLSDPSQDIAVEHFSLAFISHSGWAMKLHEEIDVGEYGPKWDITNSFGGIKQFCNEKCAGSWLGGYKPKKINLKAKRIKRKMED